MKFFRLIILIILLTGCTDSANDLILDNIEPTGTTRDPIIEAELHEILVSSVIKSITPPPTMSHREERAFAEYENNKSELIRLNLTAEDIVTEANHLSFRGDLIAIRGEYKVGFINKYGEVIIPFEYELARGFSEGLAAVAVSDGERIKWGYIDESGELVIPFIYDGADVFRDGLAVVWRADEDFYSYEWGCINKTGELVVPYSSEDYFESAFAERDFAVEEYDGPVMIRNDGEIYFVDEAGDIILRADDVPSTVNIHFLTDFRDGGVAVVNRNARSYNRNGYNGLVDKRGMIVLPCIYEQVIKMGGGMIAAQRYEGGTWEIYEIEEIG